MSDCPKGHGPKEPGKRCKVCEMERFRKDRQAKKERYEAGTHCRAGHPYREGSWRQVTVGAATLRDCLLCRAIANRKNRHPTGAAKRTYPGKVNTRRVGMRERISAIHIEILAACDRMDLMTAAERAEWRATEAELRQEADLLQVQLDTGNSATQRAKRLRAKGLPVA